MIGTKRKASGERWKLPALAVEFTANTPKASSKLQAGGQLPESLFSTYGEIVNRLLDCARAKEITSFKRLRAEKYSELRMKYPALPSHYIYTACQMACSVYKSFRKLKRRSLACEEGSFRKLQEIIDYKAKLAGLNVVYVDAKGTSGLCPICVGN